MGARRVKKICRWHIFSQSGEQAVLATWAEGCRRKATERALTISYFMLKFPSMERAPAVLYAQTSVITGDVLDDL